MAVNGHSIEVVMVKNGQTMTYAYSNPSAYDTWAISVVLALKKGDKVWIGRFNSERHIHGDYNLFSGYLVSKKIWVIQNNKSFVFKNAYKSRINFVDFKIWTVLLVLDCSDTIEHLSLLINNISLFKIKRYFLCAICLFLKIK